MIEPRYHLTGVVRTREELLEDFEGPLDVILLLLGKNKIEIAKANFQKNQNRKLPEQMFKNAFQ